MKHHLKFANLEDELIDLSEVLKNSLQNEVLAIKKLDKNCDKFQHMSTTVCDLQKAEYVIFSKFMSKEFHHVETFVFIDVRGNIVCNLSGREIDLYNMIKDCDNLIESPEYD